MADSLAEVFVALRAIMKPFEPRMKKVLNDEPGKYYLLAGLSDRFRKDIWWGGVEVKKNYVSYHLIAVYMHPELLGGLPPALRKRMQGKSCFNFRKVDEELFRDLAALTRRAFDRFVTEGIIR